MWQRLGDLEERQHRAEARLQQVGNLAATPGAQWTDVQVKAELERFRKLFEFVEGVLPKDAAKAMKFFSHLEEGGADGEEGGGSGLGTDADLDFHRLKLQEQVDGHAADMRGEFEKLTTAIKAVQRDLERTGGKVSDLNGRITGVEREARQLRHTGSSATPSTPAAEPADHGGSGDGGPGAEPSSPLASSPPRASERHPKGDLAHLMEAEGGMPGGQTPLPYVSKKSLQQALEDLRDDVRSWLDMLHASMLAALQQKADHENVKDLVSKVARATDIAGDSIAMFAKRSLIGKCASCDTPFCADPNLVKRAPPVSLERPWPPRGSPGAQVAIRPPESKSYMPVQQPSNKDPARLPRITETKGGRDFPKGKVLRNASQPELRSLRQDLLSAD